jgi:hypothetical protein
MTRATNNEADRLHAWIAELDQVTHDRVQKCHVRGDFDPAVIYDLTIILATQDVAFDTLCALERT